MQINIQGQDDTQILVETFPEKGVLAVTSIHPVNLADGDCYHTAIFTVKEAGQLIAAIQLAREFVSTWNSDHAEIYEAFRAKHENKAGA